jgi:hypothetical protein
MVEERAVETKKHGARRLAVKERKAEVAEAAAAKEQA